MDPPFPEVTDAALDTLWLDLPAAVSKQWFINVVNPQPAQAFD